MTVLYTGVLFQVSSISAILVGYSINHLCTDSIPSVQ